MLCSSLLVKITCYEYMIQGLENNHLWLVFKESEHDRISLACHLITSCEVSLLQTLKKHLDPWPTFVNSGNFIKYGNKLITTTKGEESNGQKQIYKIWCITAQHRNTEKSIILFKWIWFLVSLRLRYFSIAYIVR